VKALYARALYIDRGGDPRVFDDIAWEDIEAWLSIVPILDERRALGGLADDRDTSAYPRLPVSDECSDTLSEPRSEQAGVERTP